ncbi:MAG: thioredoxin domain-containing protein [Parcubacteria group bacterium]|nr:thioredoxin domain-containing protein [Parcubacteria group bacterium]
MADREEKAVKWTLVFSFVLLFAFAVVLLLRSAPTKQTLNQERADQELIEAVIKTAPSQGPANASVVLVEYADFQCPACKTLEPILDRITQEQPQIRRVWINTINRTDHPEAENAAVAGQCAHQQGKFWEYRKGLFENQDQLSATVYNQLAQSLKLSTPAFQACLADSATRTTVRTHDQFARRSNVEATPYLMVNNTVITDQFTYENITRAIAAETARLTTQP